MTFAPIYSLDKSMLVAKSQIQSADLSWSISKKIMMVTDSGFVLASYYDSI